MRIKNIKLTSAALTRSLLLLICLLLLSLWLLGFQAVNAYLIEKKHSMAVISAGLQKRIDRYRTVADQLYDLSVSLNNSESMTNTALPREVRLRPDVYYVDKAHKKTDALIFGAHDASTLLSAAAMSSYLDILWGAENNQYSLYFLNGTDNSLTLISTQPLRDSATRFEDSYVSTLIKTRRAEMLQQANILDQRESFSPLRKYRFQNDYYFTQRIIFNQPGHLATIIAADLPVNDLIPLTMARADFALSTDEADLDVDNSDTDSGDDTQDGMQLIGSQIKGSTLFINARLPDAPLNLVYRVPLTSLTVDLLRNNLWPIAINLLMIALSMIGIYLVRQHFLRPRENMARALKSRQILSEEVIANLPLGLLVYDFGANNLVASNKIADHLLPHLSLQKIANLAESHQGIIQATVNNEVYEIRMYKSRLSPETYLFQLLDHDKEVLVNKKLQQAQQELNKNHQARRAILSNLQHELDEPLREMTGQVDELLCADDEQTRRHLLASLKFAAGQLRVLFDNVRWLTQLELQDWQPEPQAFSLSTLVEELLAERLSDIRIKGLSLFNHFRLSLQRQYTGDGAALKKILSLLLDYSIINTAYGKIVLTTEQDPVRADTVLISLDDTGSGIDAKELANLQQPFIHPVQRDTYRRGSGLTWFLCNHLSKKMGGGLEIHSTPDIGTRYRLRLLLPVMDSAGEGDAGEQEKILAGVLALLDIANDEVHVIVSDMLTQWGAEVLHPDEHLQPRQHDLLFTDDPSRLEDFAVLLQGDTVGISLLTPRRLAVNYNLCATLLEAVLQLMELRLEHAENTDDAAQETQGAQADTVPLLTGDYIPLFVETVPDDVKRLYTEAENGDLSALAQTAHRLKGVFAMLNLVHGKQLCEMLEQHIKLANRENDNSKIGHDIRQIDVFVIKLLQHAR
ncbi:phosphotransferase RcsD [Martelella alba]|uniref:histidine kinase n=1 Tax=Martelella alba TaxID=2590451 RepID=A0ABY2SHJ8_9HYPH|nr:phosphotransferase RcsD [Martelella alba]TKI04790.1 phosphotransferase RcsD [Martelella alba]